MAARKRRDLDNVASLLEQALAELRGAQASSDEPGPLATELLDVNEVAAVLGLANPTSVSVYRARHEDFPKPALVKVGGKFLLWWRDDVVRWKEAHPGRTTA